MSPKRYAFIHMEKTTNEISLEEVPTTYPERAGYVVGWLYTDRGFVLFEVWLLIFFFRLES